ncbi:hypothetical protein PSEUBRA_005868 [Kalmanozyma brasiliensis GHG001]|uniref:Uncharacterized protein n=1 Tax=Kalmanozyma brasiliensis (strain GHG001) TaxID=1365824 RepID=V5EJT6_KALBG|nr:uncharacterized protein PSEUBRA_005868 [Kalmanozyma brasiliensis GHG001]EST05060.1 hypothetical protein PSEUBRA_005868 [Kalmanozyma brasiliensis GHG001]
MIARSLSRSARPLARSAAGPSLARLAVRRYATNPPGPVASKSDAPWAIASVITFGGLFVYLTAPGAKKDDHGHHGSKHDEAHDEEEDDSEPEAPKEPVELPDGSIEHPEGFVEVKRPEVRHDAPEGDKHLHSQKISDEDAHEKQKNVKRETALPKDDTTFKHGVAAAKDGNPISDPKKVVAAAKTAKQEKAQAKAGAAQGSSNDDNGDDDEE